MENLNIVKTNDKIQFNEVLFDFAKGRVMFSNSSESYDIETFSGYKKGRFEIQKRFDGKFVLGERNLLFEVSHVFDPETREITERKPFEITPPSTRKHSGEIVNFLHREQIMETTCHLCGTPVNLKLNQYIVTGNGKTFTAYCDDHRESAAMAALFLGFED